MRVKASLLLMAGLGVLLASCEVEHYAGIPSTEENFVSVIAAENYRPSSSIVTIPQLAAAISSPATAASLFPFAGMENDGIREIHFYNNDGFSFPYGTQTVTGVYDRSNEYYYLLMGSGSSAKGLVYTDSARLDELASDAHSLYKRDYAICYASYETFMGIALGTLDGFDSSLYSNIEIGYSNIGSTAGYSLVMERDNVDGNDYKLEFNITMDLYEDGVYAITDCSYRLREYSIQFQSSRHYVKEFKFASAAQMSNYNWTKSNYVLSFAGTSADGVTEGDFFGAF